MKERSSHSQRTIVRASVREKIKVNTHKVSSRVCVVEREVKAAKKDRKCLELKEKGSTHKDFDTE